MRPNEVIAERFEIERLAGAGGMGAVYRAKDRSTGQSVAIKVLHGTGAREAERFVRESVFLADLVHPGIVRYVAHGSTQEDDPYLAMEWLEGEDLAQRIHRTGLTVHESVLVIRRAAQALSAAHARGIVHRDIKPSNLYLVQGDPERVKVLDFGIARRGAQSIGMTRTGVVLGTPGYMAPEQARGDRTIDPRADVFSLGAVLFECIAGQPPFSGHNVMALLAKILLEDAPRLRDVDMAIPAALDAVVARMMAKNPAERPADGREVVEALEQLGELGEVRRRMVTKPPEAITRGEQRSFSVVLLRGVGPGSQDEPSDPNVPGFNVDATVIAVPPTRNSDAEALVDIREAAASWGGQTEVLADGSAIVTIATRDAVSEQAVRAARCALGLHALVPNVPMAVATGRGEMAARWPVGEVIDEAARLLHSTDSLFDVARDGDPQPIRINDVIAGLLDTRFEVERRRGVLVLRSERAEPDAARPVLGKPVTCVGRDRELAILESAFIECVEESIPRAVLLTAPSGYGKSRVRHELLKRLSQRDVPPRVWMARGDPMRTGSAFGMLSQVLRAALEIRSADPLELRRAHLRAHLRTREILDPARHAEFLGEIIGVPTDEPSPALRAARQDAVVMNEQLLRTWQEYLAAECNEGPVVIVLEDLHWGDRTTCTFIDVALRELSQSQFTVLGVARPEIEDVFPKLWSERSVHALRLGELGKKACEKIVRQVLGTKVTDAVVDRVVSQAAGNAYFLEELIRAVHDGKGDALPGSVLAIAQARLEALDPDERRSLRAASIFGQFFWEGGVRALLGGGAHTTQVGEWLGSLTQREILVKRPESKFEGENEYMFRNGLLRETSYAMLTGSDRTLGHKLAGAWLEKMGETDAVVLAAHYERGGEAVRAIECYRRAARQALEGNDIETSLARVDKAIRLGAEGEALGHLLAIRTEALMWRGDYRESQPRALAAVELLPKGTPAWFKAVGLAIWISRNVNDRENMLRVISVLEQHGPGPALDPAQAMPAALALWTLNLLRKYDLAAAFTFWLEQLVEITPDEDAGSRGWAHFGLHFGRLHLGEPELVYRDALLAVKFFQEAGDTRNAAAAVACLARAALYVGRDKEAYDACQTAIQLNTQGHSDILVAAARRFVACLMLRRGELAQALETFKKAVDFLYDHEKNPVLGALWTADFSIHLVMNRQADAAEEAATRALEHLDGVPPMRTVARAVIARAHLLRGRAREALEIMRDVMEFFARADTIGDGEVFVRLTWAEVLGATGDVELAREALERVRKHVLTVADRIKDPELRADFLGNVPENVQTFAAVEKIAAG